MAMNLSTPSIYPQYGSEDVRVYPLADEKYSRIERELAPDPSAELHPTTAGEYGVSNGDWIFVETKKGKIKVKVVTTDDIMAGVVNIMHGWAEDLNQNVLTDLEHRDPVTGYPELRALACKISKAA